MDIRRLNWRIWLGFLLVLFAFVSYPFIFVRWPITRDLPWANFFLFAVAMWLVITGLKRAFASGSRISRIGASFATGLSVVILAFFVFLTFGMTKNLPASKGAPQVGQKAPEFTLANQNGRFISLAESLSAPINGRSPKGLVIVFYRGYW